MLGQLEEGCTSGWRELHIWYIQYFLKVTATLPFGRGPGARCIAQQIRICSCIPSEGKAKISLSAESQLPVTSSTGAGELHGDHDLSASHSSSCRGSYCQPRHRAASLGMPPWGPQARRPVGPPQQDLVLLPARGSRASIRGWLVPLMAKEVLDTRPCPCGLAP